MSDHESYCDYVDELNIGAEDVLEDYNSENVIVEERNGDDFLIELYRERPFLYDKKNSNFKNILMKENAWKEISKIMIATNCGNYCIRLFIEFFKLYMSLFVLELLLQVIFTHHNIVKNVVAHYESNTIVRKKNRKSI